MNIRMSVLAMLGAGLVMGWAGSTPVPPTREPVTSSLLDGLAYDARTGDLTLWFDHGGVYVYREVPATVVERLRSSPSKGRFYQAHLRGRFDSACVAITRRSAVAPAALAGGVVPPTSPAFARAP